MDGSTWLLGTEGLRVILPFFLRSPSLSFSLHDASHFSDVSVVGELAILSEAKVAEDAAVVVRRVVVVRGG